MRVVEKSDKVSLLFEDTQTGMVSHFTSEYADQVINELS
jgi:hypothetical protein